MIVKDLLPLVRATYRSLFVREEASKTIAWSYSCPFTKSVVPISFGYDRGLPICLNCFWNCFAASSKLREGSDLFIVRTLSRRLNKSLAYNVVSGAFFKVLRTEYRLSVFGKARKSFAELTISGFQDFWCLLEYSLVLLVLWLRIMPRLRRRSIFLSEMLSRTATYLWPYFYDHIS